MKNPRFSKRGSILAFTGAIGIALGILVLYISQSVKVNSHQMVYFDNMNKAYRVAESGLAVAMGQLAVNPSTGSLPSGELPGIGRYDNYVERSSLHTYDGFYIRTTSTVTANGKTYSTELHSYANVANLGSYFAAMKNEFVLSPGMDASGGAIYAPNLIFLTSGTVPSKTRALSAEYVYATVARVNGNSIADNSNPSTWPTEVHPPSLTETIIPHEICLGSNQQGSGISECRDGPGGNWVLPTQRSFPLRFPELNGSDFNRYTNLATPAHTRMGSWWDFTSWDHIMPPGYVGSSLFPDPYAGHSTNNAHKVFYSDQGIRVGKPAGGTEIHGTIVLVTPGNIEIHGDLLKSVNTWMPGQGHVSSSTAHELILIAGGEIRIMTGGLAANSSRTINAFFFAPNGGMFIEGTATPPANRSFTFLGSWVLGQAAIQPNNLPTQFTGTRNYAYDLDFKIHPPPYMPALSQLFYSFERSQGSNLYQ